MDVFAINAVKYVINITHGMAVFASNVEKKEMKIMPGMSAVARSAGKNTMATRAILGNGLKMKSAMYAQNVGRKSLQVLQKAYGIPIEKVALTVDEPPNMFLQQTRFPRC